MATETCEIHLNRRGINSVEVPPQIELAPGSTLQLRLINHGSPLHVTISSPNSRMFTDFYHENIYLRDTLEYSLRILENAYAGFFDVEVITGYGTNRGVFRVFVARVIEKEITPPVPDHPPEPPRARSLMWMVPLAAVLAAALGYGAWIVSGDIIWNYLAFAALVVGVFTAWSARR
jgi:hypothetical protein